MTLNRVQRVIVSVGGCVVFLRLLYPPWVTQRGGQWVGDYLIFSPPGFQEIRPYYPVKVDAVLLLFQIATIVFGTALLVWWFQPHQASAQSPPKKTSERSIMQRIWNASFTLPRFELSRWLGRRRFLWLVALCLVLLALFGAMYNKSAIMRDPLKGATALPPLPPGFTLDAPFRLAEAKRQMLSDYLALPPEGRAKAVSSPDAPEFLRDFAGLPLAEQAKVLNALRPPLDPPLPPGFTLDAPPTKQAIPPRPLRWEDMVPVPNTNPAPR